MSVRMRHTSSHTKNRRSHHALVEGAIVVDKESGALRLPHRIDETTGMYRGKQIVPKKEVKAAAKKHAHRLEAHDHDHDEAAAMGVKEPVHAEIVSDKKVAKGLAGRMQLGKAKSRSGFGGGA
jgi:ribosomal protein L32